LPKDLQTIVDRDAHKAAAEINPRQAAFYAKQRQVWLKHGHLISLPPKEQARMMTILSSVGGDVAKQKPDLQQAYSEFIAIVKRTK
jgi:hypothetical protein